MSDRLSSKGPFLYLESFDDVPEQYTPLIRRIVDLTAWRYVPCDVCSQPFPEHRWLVVELDPDRVTDCSERAS
jgi:hypothetical protein